MQTCHSLRGHLPRLTGLLQPLSPGLDVATEILAGEFLELCVRGIGRKILATALRDLSAQVEQQALDQCKPAHRNTPSMSLASLWS
jgi:hypothetical protein